MNPQITSSAELAECARRLESLVRRASTFVAQQLGQLDDIGLQMAAEARQASAVDVVAEPNEQEWHQQKTVDEQRIDEQLEHLANAWKQLESEQRRLMILERDARQPTFELAAALGNDMQPADADPDGTAAPQPAAAPRRSRDLIDETAPQDAAAAALQFQKLKREIRQQTRRQR